MRSIVLLLALAGCGSSEDELPDAAVPDMVCAVCPACGAGETCLHWRDDQMPVCVSSCAAASDCAPGLRCTQLDGRTDWLCLSSSLPGYCAPGAHTSSCTIPASSCDGATLLAGFSEGLNGTCGLYRHDCANGCSANGDGGFGCL
jgi:hypothetical protein